MATPRTILVVEDDPILKNLLGNTFSGKYDAYYANDGAEAIELLEKHKPALVMLDLLMPNVDGFAVIERVRARTDGLKDVPILVVSNLGQAGDVERAMKLGANGYLVKAENSIEEIIAKIEEVLST